MEISKSVYKFKITLFGSEYVGKTSIVLKYVKDYFKSDLKKTIGSNFLIKVLDFEDKQVNLMIWDIAGQTAFQHLRTIYFKGSNAALGVYDVTDPQTLLKIPGWISSIKKSVKRNIPMILIGNKIDLKREVPKQEAEELAERLNCDYIETSAKTGENINLAFDIIAKKCLDYIKKKV